MAGSKSKLSARARDTLALIVEHIVRELYPEVYAPESTWRITLTVDGSSHAAGLKELWALVGYGGTPADPKGIPEMWKHDFKGGSTRK